MPAAAEMPAPPPPPPLLLLLLLACCAGTCPGAPVLSQGLQPEQEPQLWNEIRDACSAFLSLDSQPQAPNALKELCITIMGTLPKPQETDEKDNTKRFLFHYSKTRKLGNSNVVSSVLHPLLQLVPQLHERRMKRFRLDEEFQGPIASQVRRQFLFRVCKSCIFKNLSTLKLKNTLCIYVHEVFKFVCTYLSLFIDIESEIHFFIHRIVLILRYL
uniref:Neuromedin U n=1 Tax=Canis lupus familiaris TaxID=9615 RepID=A0A8C0NTU2_CANLF